MKNGLIVGFIMYVYRKIKLYYENSMLHLLFAGLNGRLRRWASGSGILGFFDRDWGMEDAWSNSFTFRILTFPARLYEGLSKRLSSKTNAANEGSVVIGSIKGILENAFNINTRVMGLLILSFSVTQGLLEMIMKQGMVLAGLEGMARAALLLLGALLVLINRPLKSLYEGSFTARIAADFFRVRGLGNGKGD